jgi:hypothetical protein
LLTEVAASVLLLVVLVLKHTGEQAQHWVGIGQDAHHLGAAVELWR